MSGTTVDCSLATKSGKSSEEVEGVEAEGIPADRFVIGRTDIFVTPAVAISAGVFIVSRDFFTLAVTADMFFILADIFFVSRADIFAIPADMFLKLSSKPTTSMNKCIHDKSLQVLS